MTRFSKAMRDFLASMPVLNGPHASIEAELLLAGIKPVGSLHVLEDDGINKPGEGWTNKKRKRDIRLLDQAVSAGKLKSVDLPARDPASGKPYIMRHYCQPDKLADMEKVFHVNQKQESGLSDTFNHEYAELLGYRKRDVMFFRLKDCLPHAFQEALVRLNDPCHWARKEQLLEQSGTTLDQWIEQLRAENIIT